MKGFRWTAGIFMAVLALWTLAFLLSVPVSAEAPEKTVIRQTGAKGRTVNLSWQRQEGAVCYKIYYKYTSQNRYRHLKDVNPSGDNVAAAVRFPKAGRVYQIQVIPYGRDNRAAGEVYQSQCRTLPGKISLRSQKSYATSRSMKFFWNAVESAQGYEFQVTDLNGKFVRRQKVENKASITISGLSAGEFYRLRIRGYSRINGKIIYGAASYMYIAQQPRVKFKWASHSAAKVSWTGISGAADYSVYVSDDPSRGFWRVKTAAVEQVLIPGLNKNWKYYVYVVANMRRGKKVYTTPRTNYYTFRLQVE